MIVIAIRLEIKNVGAVAPLFLVMKKEIPSQNTQQVRFFDFKIDPPEQSTKVLQKINP